MLIISLSGNQILASLSFHNQGGSKNESKIYHVYCGYICNRQSHPHLNITDREFDIIMIECLHTFYAFDVPDHLILPIMADLQSFRGDIVTKPTKGYKSPYNSPYNGIAK